MPTDIISISSRIWALIFVLNHILNSLTLYDRQEIKYSCNTSCLGQVNRSCTSGMGCNGLMANKPK